MKYFIFIILLLYYINFGFLFAKNNLIVDFSFTKFIDIYSYIDKIKFNNIEKIIISHPFRTYYNINDQSDIVYDYFDNRNIENQDLLYGTYNEFLKLVEFLRSNGCEIFVYLKLFYQRYDYKRDFWDNSDFIVDYYILPDIKVIDIQNDSTKNKLIRIINVLNKLPVNKWIIDFRYIPENKFYYYEEFLKKYLNSFLIISDNTSDISNCISSFYYWKIRKEIFCYPIENFYNLTNFKINSNLFHYIDSDSLSYNNIGSIIYLLSQNLKIVIPYNFINTKFTNFINYLEDNKPFNKSIISKNKLLLYNKNKIIYINFNQNLNVLKTENMNFRNGIYKGIIDNSMLSIINKNIYIFNLPMSVSLWEIK